jgi:hypothetical protein
MGPSADTTLEADTGMRATCRLLLILSLALPLGAPHAGAASPIPAPPAQPDRAADAFVGVYRVPSWAGVFTIRVERRVDAYLVSMAVPNTDAVLQAEARVDADGALHGEFVGRSVLGTARDRFWLRRDGPGYRWRSRGIDAVAEPHRATDGSPLAEQWAVELRGRRLAQLSSGVGVSRRANIHLCSDGGFRYDYRGQVSASSGGVSAGSRSSDEATGLWSVVTHLGTPVLVLHRNDGQTMAFPMEIREGTLVLDGERTFVETNELCR